MKELRIKCPVCGIILDVRNSKNEAVKQITCPSCKKRLAIDFTDKLQADSAQPVTVKTVRLADGNSKIILRVNTYQQAVILNGETLQKGDEVVIIPGDVIEFDGKTGVVGQDGNISYQDKTRKREPLPEQPVGNPPSQPRKKRLAYSILFVVVGAIVLVVWRAWTKTQEQTMIDTAIPDTIAVVKSEQPIDKKRTDKPESRKSKKTGVTKPEKAVNESGLSDYELEKAAINGNVEAQYLLGKRWFSRRDSINVVKGLKYLKLAAQNGSSEARTALNKAFAVLQQAAENGSTTAENILKEQNSYGR